jgi:hypothetical protein
MRPLYYSDVKVRNITYCKVYGEKISISFPLIHYDRVLGRIRRAGMKATAAAVATTAVATSAVDTTAVTTPAVATTAEISTALFATAKASTQCLQLQQLKWPLKNVPCSNYNSCKVSCNSSGYISSGCNSRKNQSQSNSKK